MEMIKIISSRLQNWVDTGIVGKVLSDTDEYVCFVLNKDMFDDSYRMFEFRSEKNKYRCTMTIRY
jgi:hypothetical protein